MAVEYKDQVATAFTKMDANMDMSITHEGFVSACLGKTRDAPFLSYV